MTEPDPRPAAGPPARPHRHPEMVGLGLVATAAVLWGLIGPVARVALREGVEPLELGFWRALIAGGLCAAASAAGRRARVRPRDALGIAAFGIAGVALFYASYFLAVQHGGAALASILLYTAPAFVAVASYLWLGERLTARTAAAVLLTLAGVAGVALGGGGQATLNPPGIAWGLTSGVTYALYYLVGRRYFARYGTVAVLARAMPVGALALLPLVDFHPKGAAAWQAILFIAVIPTFAGYLIYGAGLTRVAATRAATVASIEPVVASAVAIAFWGERFTAAGYAGAAAVVTAVFLAASAGGRSGDKKKQTS